MTEPSDAKGTYEHGRDAHATVVASMEVRARVLGTARLAVVALVISLLGSILWGHLGPWAWAVMGAFGVIFVALVVVHARVEDEKERALAAVRFHARGLARLAREWDKLPTTSERFRRADHPFTGDLDVFGRASLMQIVDATETRFGEERLAGLLSLQDPEEWPRATLARQSAVRDLSARVAFREGLATAAGVLSDEKPDPSGFLSWAEAPSVPAPWGVSLLSWVLPGVALAIGALASADGVSTRVATGVMVLVIVIGAVVGARFAPILDVISTRESAATRWRAMLAAIENESFQAPLLLELRSRLVASGLRASDEMAALARIVSFVDARRNEVFRFVLGPLLMWDTHCARALLRWRGRSGTLLRGWLDALGELEALASLAAFAFEHPAFAWPELAAEATLEADALGHPLLAEASRVGNDVHLPAAGLALVVTGSNMSGKSTLLRALGVNAVLANAGGPACAHAMRIGPLRVATSMRVEDSLAQGVSHFYAELGRLKRVIDRAKEPGRASVLFLLDEILHGTNSRERVLGASAVVRQLLAHGALGAVSTHDLGITALERDLGGQVVNVHLEEHVEGDKMTFDYVLRPGIVQSSNALRLMRAIGIEVDQAG
jgi:hypothetical protein